MSPWELLPHPSDLRVRARDRRELLAEAARSTFAPRARPRHGWPGKLETRELTVRGADELEVVLDRAGDVARARDPRRVVRAASARVIDTEPAELAVVYDVAHDIAKLEERPVAAAPRRVCVHRKGATRAFPAGPPEVPAAGRAVGQPVLVPGDMGRCSFVLAGQPRAMEESFGSCCHGAGRLLSRSGAKKRAAGRNLVAELAARGVRVHGASWQTVVEEMPEAYKDVADVVHVVDGAGLAKKVARLKPMGVVKG